MDLLASIVYKYYEYICFTLQTGFVSISLMPIEMLLLQRERNIGKDPHARVLFM